MSKNNDELITLKYLKEAKSFPARQALAQVESLRRGLKAMENKGTPTMTLQKIKEESLQAIRADLALSNAKERQKLNNTLGLLGDDWARDYEKHRTINERKVVEYQRKLAAMTPAEIEGEQVRMLSIGLGSDPALFDVLGAALKQSADPIVHEGFRKDLNKMAYTAPWVYSPLGKSITADLQALSDEKLGVHLKDENGNHFSMGIEEILDHLEENEKMEAEENE